MLRHLFSSFFFLCCAIMRVTCSRETGRTGAKHTLSNERLAKYERLQKAQTANLSQVEMQMETE